MNAMNDGAMGLLAEALTRLENELEEARAARDEVEAEYRLRIDPLNARVRSLEVTVAHQRGAFENYGGEPTTQVKGTSEKLSDLAFAILEASNEPTHYRTLAQQLTEQGASLAGKDPGTVLINYMRREPDRFCRTSKPGYYALVKWALDDAKPVSGERSQGTTKKRATKKQPARRRAGRAKK